MGSTSPTSRLPLRSKDASFSGELRKIRAARARSSMRLVPTSMTVAPWRMKSRVIMAGRPMAATRISASRHTAGRSGVLEWQMVTVACSCKSIMAAGLPTISLRPTMTARRPAMAMPLRFNSSTIPAGVQARGAGRFATRAPTLQGWKPSTSLAGETAMRIRLVSMCGGRGNWTRMPSISGRAFRSPGVMLGIDVRGQGQLDQDAVDFGARVQALDNRQEFGGGNGIGRCDGFGMDPEVVTGLDFVANVNLRSRVVADQDHGQAGRTAAGSQGIDARLQFALDIIAYAISVEDSRHSSQS